MLTSNSSTSGVEAGGSPGIQGQPGIHSEFHASQDKKNTKDIKDIQSQKSSEALCLTKSLYSICNNITKLHNNFYLKLKEGVCVCVCYVPGMGGKECRCSHLFFLRQGLSLNLNSINSARVAGQ